jgi:protein involved in polysaccharide export with SLBB domain
MSHRSPVLRYASRSLRCACFAAAWLCLVAGSWSPAHAQTTGEVAKRRLPGENIESGLMRSLRSPSADARWRGLEMFGRELFTTGESLLTPVENTPVGPDYVLGPTDQLQVFISGYSDTSYALTLDREGKVFLPRVGTTFLWGLGFADAERLIRSRLATVYRNARVQVSMGRMRAIEVFVLGAAARPGKYALSGMTTAFHALIAAGGPGPLGSLRGIRVMRGPQEIGRLDLYPFLLSGDRRQDPQLQNGDVVFVGLMSGRVGVQGEVVRPAVYESDGPLSLRRLLEMAGGPNPFADLSRVSVERVEANGGFRVEDVALDHGVDPDTLMLNDYDLVTVLPLTARPGNAVTLDGYVGHPGDYELVPGMKLSQLLTRERLLPEADLEHAEFRRIDPATFRTEVRAFSPHRVWTGEQDWPLQPSDAVTVFSSARLPSTVTLEGEVVRAGAYNLSPGERLSNVLKRAGGVTPRGSLRAAVFRRPSASREARALQREMNERYAVELARQQIAGAGDSARARQLEAQKLLLASFEKQTDAGRVVLKLDEEGRWVGTNADIVLEDGDRLVVPVRPATVTVLGNVMNPGTLAARKGAGSNEYVRLAGGLSRDADLGRSFVLRASGEAVPLGRAGRVDPGDAIMIAPRPSGGPDLGRFMGTLLRRMVEAGAAVAVIVTALK